MHLHIDPHIFHQFPELHIGTIHALNVTNPTPTPQPILDALRTTQNTLKTTLTPDAITTHPRITPWRNAYTTFGAKPKEHRSSIENLLRTTTHGNTLRSINTLVDIYNLISLKHLLPTGGEDLNKTHGDIHLTHAGPHEPPVLLLGDKEPRPPHHGEIIYKDDVSAICRRWNWREADRTKLTPATKRCILIIEALPPATKNDTLAATEELQHLVHHHCGGTLTSTILNKNHPSFPLQP